VQNGGRSVLYFVVQMEAPIFYMIVVFQKWSNLLDKDRKSRYPNRIHTLIFVVMNGGMCNTAEGLSYTEWPVGIT
jgi:hypothetical protein